MIFELLQHYINLSPSLPQRRILSLHVLHLDPVMQLYQINRPLHIRVLFSSFPTKLSLVACRG